MIDPTPKQVAVAVLAYDEACTGQRGAVSTADHIHAIREALVAALNVTEN